MKDKLSPLQRFAERVESFQYPPREGGEDSHGRYLQSFQESLPAPEAPQTSTTLEEIEAALSETGARVAESIGSYQLEQYRALAVRNLQVGHSFIILFERSLLVDALHRFAFERSSEEFSLLARRCAILTEREIAQKKGLLPRKQAQLQGLRGELGNGEEQDTGDVDSADGDSEGGAPRAYYEKIAQELSQEIEEHESGLRVLEESLASLQSYSPPQEEIEQRVVLFARGGYGRAELSFSSDLDTGYCLDTRGLDAGQIAAYHEFVLRVEKLVAAMGLDTVHQFFEIEEDLHRFTAEESMHTIPAILESRTLAGNGKLLGELKGRFKAILPFETLVRKKTDEYESQIVPGLTSMDLKNDFGGLRSIQIPLWLLGITHTASSFMTMDLLQLARQKKIVSLWEVSRLLMALEFIYELRNFTGAGEEFYYDREARESGFHVPEFQANRIDDHLTRLYLFRRQRFTSVDDFDAHRLWLVDEVQKISHLMMSRVLDRTIIHKMGSLQASVHLGRKCIISVNSVQNGGASAGSADPSALFQDGAPLLTLFSYIAQTDYDLSIELKDTFSGVVMGFAIPTDPQRLEEQARQMSDIIGAPFAHRALATLFEINDPLSRGAPSLLGRFIPILDRVRFLVRRFDTQSIPLQEYLLRTMACGQEALETLRREYPDLSVLVQPEHVLAFKWSLLLSGLGRIGSGPAKPSHTAEEAADLMLGLGYRDSELLRRVRLLIEHHGSLISLSRTATYMDQALAQFFEIAERNLVHVILLYLVNLSLLQARGESSEGDQVRLKRLFREADQMLGEMQGFPVQERSLEMINVYFDRKKKDLIADTRMHLLLQKSIAQGFQETVLQPLEKAGGKDWDRLQPHVEELQELQKKIQLGDLKGDERDRLVIKLVQGLRQKLSEDSIRYLLAGENSLAGWFFASYPNRFLIGSNPRDLAAEIAKFSDFRRAKVIVDIVPAAQGRIEGLLIFTRGLTLSHSRVAYALNRTRLNISSGKVNRVEIGEGKQGYCYYFEIARMEPESALQARDLEQMILNESPPELEFPERSPALEKKGVRVEFREDDGKGYRVVPDKDEYVRVPADFLHIRLVLRDQPFLFYKVSRAFDLFDVEIQQSLITTTGNQVMDYFYLLPEDYRRLAESNFEEVLIHLVNSDLSTANR